MEEINLDYWDGDSIYEIGCCIGDSSLKSDVDGVCPDCGYPTVEGIAASGCAYSPVSCDTCGHAECDGSC